MPLTGAFAWKEEGLGPEERIDRFFNLIDHAVEGGVPLSELYSRRHIKEFLLYTLRRHTEFCRTRHSTRSEDHHMPKLTLTSTFASSITIGDPGVLAFNLAPKETKTVEATEAQIRQLTPGLEKLKAAGWINYVVNDGAAAPVEVKPVAPPPPPAPPAPEPVAPAPTPDPVVEPVEAAPAAPAEDPVAPAEPTAEEAPAPAPSAPKPPTFDRKNRNR
jgi:hypothetical protein